MKVKNLIWVLVAVFTSYLAKQDPLEVNFIGRIAPSFEFPFGTDRLGCDMYSGVLYGARVSLSIGVISVVIR